jgi:DNA replication licensing factor MCM5
MGGNERPMPEGELSLQFLKKYVNYCRHTCGPRLNDEASRRLADRFVHIRDAARRVELDTEQRSAIPITIRQLEAIVRISESLAKMSLSPFATVEHVDEAMRLFRVCRRRGGEVEWLRG